tara:strand:+ start:1774 stop:2466 length:693 start_codon:yes stop_codon:yes gene_type:complete
MGHGGRHTYEETINNLFEQINPDIFANKVLHLKSREEESDIAGEIKDFCSEKNIRVIESKEEIVHHSENHLNHSAGYFKDIFKVYSDLEIRKQKYSFWLEDDWLLRPRVVSLETAFKQSVDFLDDNPDQLCVRFNSSKGFSKAENSIKQSHNFFTQDLNYTEYGPTFTFQPNINRTNEIFIAWKSAQLYLDKLDVVHCELLSGELLKQVTNTRTPFSFFNPKKIYSEHIG